MREQRPTQRQLAELKRLSKEARVPDESEIVTTKEEAETRIRDLKKRQGSSSEAAQAWLIPAFYRTRRI